MQIGVLILLWMVNERKQEWKQKMNWQVSFPRWILKVKNSLLKKVCNWQEKIIDAKYSTVGLQELAWDKKTHLGWDLNEGATEENDVNNHPTPIVKSLQARVYAKLLLIFCNGTFFIILTCKVMNMPSIMDKLSKMLISKITNITEIQ